MTTVLFVCTGNQYRSPIAAETFRELVKSDGLTSQWRVESAGTWTSNGQHPFQNAIEMARTYGLNIEGHITRMLDAKMIDQADLILVMEKGHLESIQIEFPLALKKVHLLSQVLEGISYDIPDPINAGNDQERGEIIRDLVAMVRAGVQKIYRIAGTIQGQT